MLGRNLKIIIIMNVISRLHKIIFRNMKNIILSKNKVIPISI